MEHPPRHHRQPATLPHRQEKRLRQWEHRPQPQRPDFPEPDPPIWKPMG